MRKRDSLQDQSDVVNGAFWKRHWDIDARLTKLGIILPVLLRSGAEANPGNCLGVDVSTQAIAIGLYKTAAVKVKKVGLELSISQQCAARCQNAADEVVKAVKAADFDSINSVSYIYIGTPEHRNLNSDSGQHLPISACTWPLIPWLKVLIAHTPSIRVDKVWRYFWPFFGRLDISTSFSGA